MKASQMSNCLIFMVLFFFASVSSAARIINIGHGYLQLRSELPATNFTDVAFPQLKKYIHDCKSGDWKDWQTAFSKGRSCDEINWSKELESGCEAIWANNTTDSGTNGTVAFSDKVTCPTEDILFFKYSDLYLIDETTFQYKIILKGWDATDFCRVLGAGGAELREENGWTIWYIQDLAVCERQGDKEETLRATINFR